MKRRRVLYGLIIMLLIAGGCIIVKPTTGSSGVDYQFTAKMEEELDLVEEGKLKYQNLLSDFFKPFKEELAFAEENIVKTLEIYDSRKELNEENRVALNKIYNWLPFETSNILDLLVFGKLNYDEIAEIKDLDRVEVKNIINAISKNFRKNLN